MSVSTQHPYFGIFAMLACAVIIFFGLVFLAAKIGNNLAAKNRKKLGLGIYECGPIPVKQANKINSQFFVVALIFILLDIEVVFLFPWALIFKDLGWFGFLEVVVFILLLGIGFLYAYKKGAFQWQSIK
ncbi:MULTISPECIES: NAD(P)H-quinone oxidoreductase subunit 3 [unclassified Campylobacter]|uniref:NAD(P)H-quinone oxidoreductase subunit 3 n=1 Tax=unclassified Campylobacter TaxID=2593542 RepID=UPI001238056C|nr:MULTISPECIES: NAD(P)H-quinone oxidoreductase subunit 3 [unclassified Campylobacter]KAA6227279.1 NAD(P)H-quinone oxidoreductase subunit 3 [Campylobacter sp. LR286c]KAA6227848.1 NAD(P)H-quinone oxidoreductase subunit 3 [Campylobacter sp. LR185c]KAA6228256.1 NAD(P)H-quinone oxidoreductase subunit 3 [Campylobacter sp. LR196d]KAA6229256.1 NAD(P)H-quinone oxidoreductase subunit 3 [Campylobacter sp. LR291e]KAA6231062.1 NAD(P)H-quinone oxidoreductase subunit 3 [Campylobacter sp. LR264d]